MTLAEKICEAGAIDLAEYLCMDTAIGEVTMVYYGTTQIEEARGLPLQIVQDIILIEEAVVIQEQVNTLVLIEETAVILEEKIDVIC